MSDKRCLTELELASFVDVNLPPERLERVEHHLTQCSSCARQVAELRELVLDMKAPLPEPSLDVAAHVAGVMQRLDAQSVGREHAQSRRNWMAWSGALAVAAAAGFLVITHGNEEPESEFAARGGSDEASLARDVGVKLYTQTTAVHPLAAGARIRAREALTAGLRNLGEEPAHLLLFAVDSKQAVHWIAPAYTMPGSDPAASSIGQGSSERLLPSSAVFDDLAPGALQVFAVLTREPTRVSNVERLPPSELSLQHLRTHFPNAEIRQFSLEVSP